MTRYGLFVFGPVDFAVPLTKLRKIIHQRKGHRLPRLPEGVAEVIVEDQQLIPVLELPEGGSAGWSVRLAEYKVLTLSEAGLVAFPADRTCGIVAASRGKEDASGKEQPRGVAGLFVYQNKQYKILDIDLLALGITQTSLDSQS